jgi:hypothetical protein
MLRLFKHILSIGLRLSFLAQLSSLPQAGLLPSLPLQTPFPLLSSSSLPSQSPSESPSSSPCLARPVSDLVTGLPSAPESYPGPCCFASACDVLLVMNCLQFHDDHDGCLGISDLYVDACDSDVIRASSAKLEIGMMIQGPG